MATETETTARALDMAYEWQSDARVWIDPGHLESYALSSPLKLTITEAAMLYRVLGTLLREYVGKAKDIELALTDEIENFGGELPA